MISGGTIHWFVFIFCLNLAEIVFQIFLFHGLVEETVDIYSVNVLFNNFFPVYGSFEKR